MKIDLETPGAAQQNPAATQQPAQEPSAALRAENVGATILKKDIAAQVPEALSPEMIAYTNSTLKAAISEILGQVLPPIIAEMKKPSEKDRLAGEEHDKFMERMKREKQQGFEQDAQNKANLEKLQRDCSHTDANARPSISLNHNFPDHLPRGICVQCRLMIEPAHYSLAVPGLNNETQVNYYLGQLAKQGITGWKPFYNKTTGRCTHFLIPEHALYQRVRELEARNGGN
jgi:hypothetical protein